MKLRLPGFLAWITIGVGVAASAATGGCGNSGTGSGGGSGSGGSGGSGDNPCFDYASFNGSSPTKQFKADVLPIFRRSCGLSDSCHGPDSTGDVNLPPNQPYLGPPIGGKDPDAADIAKILGGIVDQPAEVLKGTGIVPEPDGLKIVDPGHPESSFMMSKLDAVLNTNDTSTFCSKLKCAADKDCGYSMPEDGPSLEAGDTNTIRLWIAQGAKND